MTENSAAPETSPKDQPQPAAVPESSEDDKRAEAAAANRKRALVEWEENKKRWRSMGVPKALPAKK
ncbi:MAG TPA: hypothetical protein VGL03_08700 [Thermoanaerobaculia bacterium]